MPTGASQSFVLKYATDRYAAGSTIASITADGSLSGQTVSNTSTIPADNWIWVEVGTSGGTAPAELHFTVDYTED